MIEFNASNIALALIVGTCSGAGCAFFKLPIPAPDKIEGIVGILGVFLGMIAVKQWMA